MAGTVEGGKKAAATSKRRYGKSFYKDIGKAGGKLSRGGGFADQTIGPDGLTNAQRAGIKGGTISRRGPESASPAKEKPLPAVDHPWRQQGKIKWTQRIADRLAELRRKHGA